ncbi:putative non-specific serine/threonine protein kinase [Rosa chinensis]|uniref:Putative non-specific serine/threonine protein kinase n=1 Tax=Rosa chinensis TaxID=74649 RepID=A0A2P6RPN5_ROSCH|nr:putative non-specific serine/threonine protein kinase [Rosa chinensis]
MPRRCHSETLRLRNSLTSQPISHSFSTRGGLATYIAFSLAPVGFQIPPNSAGGFLSLLNTTTSDFSWNKIVLVEFDSFVNTEWDPPYLHVGINKNSIASVL